MRAEPDIKSRTTTVEEAQEIILLSVARGPVEEVPLARAAGRVLAQDISAGEDLWPFPRAAMDGVAVRAADVAGASAHAPARLRVAGTVYAGDAWPVPLAAGEAVGIATGAPVPPGGDAVVPREMLSWEGHDVLVASPVPAGRHIFPAGEDARAGEVVLREGTVLQGGQVGLLAALGRSTVPVIRQAVVAILATGDELVLPEAGMQRGHVRESNSYVLAAEVGAVGAVPRLLGIARDLASDLAVKILEGVHADALILCGGVSVGDRDLVREAMRHAGVALKFAGVAMKPGAPVAFGMAGACPVFALPGTPGAARIAFELLVWPALCLMMGHRSHRRPVVRARLDRALEVRPGRRRFLWARASLGAWGVHVEPLPGQGTAALRSASDANALIEVGPGDGALSAGSTVKVHLLIPDLLPAAPAGGCVALGVAGGRGAGKTTLIERLIPELRRRGLAVAAVKHHAHSSAADDGRTDTGRYAGAGASETVLAGPGCVVHRWPAGEEPPLGRVLAEVGPADLILVEGYSGSGLPKILVQRPQLPAGRPAPAGSIIAVVGMSAEEPESGIAIGVLRFGWNDMPGLADHVARWRDMQLADRFDSTDQEP